MEASKELLQKQSDLDYLTLDYLSEVSLSIMAVQQEKDKNAGYAKDFVEVVKSIAPFWKDGSKVKVVTNAGGLNPKECAQVCMEVLKQFELFHLKVAIVDGDNVIEQMIGDSENPLFCNLETNEPITTVLDKLTTANAYLGAKAIVEALKLGADLVITGRIADPSMVVAPCVAHFKWDLTDYDKIAQATVAGHLIECGTQVTGGIYTHWLEITDDHPIGFPFVEIDSEANVVVTKPEGTGGRVTSEIVKEQLLYEIGDPGAYLSPDATVSFLSLSLEQIEKNRVLVKGAKGKAPPSTYKVSATYRDGYRAEGMLVIYGRHCEKKARKAGEIMIARMKEAGYVPQRHLIECLGCGDVAPGLHPFGIDKTVDKYPLECVLRIAVADQRKEVLEYFSRQMAPLVTNGPPGTTGYTSGRPHIRQVFGYWPCLVKVDSVSPQIAFLGDIK
jgi:hypothetical protein